MLRFTAIRLEPLDEAAVQRAVHLRLAHVERTRSRLATVLPDGTAVAVLLPRGTVLRNGMVLTSDDGTVGVVEAVPQLLARISGEPLPLLRATYHLANRHVPAQLAADHLLIERDPVLERMLHSFDVRIDHVELPFDPEPGAFEGHSHAREDRDDVCATIGEQLSIEAHRGRA
jgi:urease accessory protein